MVSSCSARGFFSALLDLFLPRRCVVCGCTLGRNESHVCTSCLADLPRTYFSKMRVNPMFERFNALLVREPAGTPASYATALFYYRASTGYRDITRSLKYHADFGTGRFFARMLGDEMAGSGLFSDVDAVIPVPLHWTRKWSRGYNQALVIARVLASRLDADLLPRVLRRCRRTGSQTRLSVEEKAANVRGAFRRRKSADLSGYSHILLVDDVFTTGATLRECHAALVLGGQVKARVSIATLAFAGS